MIYNREEFSKRQKDLIERIDVLKKYYKKDVVDYLYDLVNLKETIIKDSQFLDEFGSLDIIDDLMKFNIIGRIYNVIDNDKNLKQQNIISNSSVDLPKISYRRGYEVNFDLISADFKKISPFGTTKGQKHKLIIKESEDRTDDIIYNYTEKIERITEDIEKLKNEKNIIEKRRVGLFKTIEVETLNLSAIEKLRFKREELERLQTFLLKVKKYGHLESSVSKEIANLVISDLGLKDEDFSNTINKSSSKEYKYLNIIRRLK